jgi:hypothetical protein
MALRMHLKCDTHDLDIFGDGDRWSLAIDGLVLRQRFRSMIEAREAGLAELVRIRPAAALPESNSSEKPASAHAS